MFITVIRKPQSFLHRIRAHSDLFCLVAKIDKMGYDKSKFKGYNCDSNEKYSVSAIESFENKDTVLTTIIEIKVDDINEVKLIEITGFEKLNNI